MKARPLLLAALVALFSSSAHAEEKRTRLSDHLYIEYAGRGILPQRTVDWLVVREPSGSFTRIAEVRDVAVSRDGRSGVFMTGPWTDREKHGRPGIHRYVVGRGDTLLYSAAELGGGYLRLYPELENVLRFSFKDSVRNARGTPWVINGDGEISPLILHGASPLHVAAYDGRLATIDSLILGGADRNARTHFHMYPAELAFLVRQDQAALRLLDGEGRSAADLRAVLREAVRAERWSMVAEVLRRGGGTRTSACASRLEPATRRTIPRAIIAISPACRRIRPSPMSGASSIMAQARTIGAVAGHVHSARSRIASSIP